MPKQHKKDERMHAQETYALWQKKVTDAELKQELENIKNNEQEIANRFTNYLQFGTAGLRGVLGAGINNINIHTISKATQGISNYLNANFQKPTVVIAYDNRKYSDRFSKLAAEIFAKNNIKVLLFDRLTPTPVVSYAVRTLGATIGVNITSSHNSKIYNGYKVVNEFGAQIGSDQAKQMTQEINKVNEFEVKTLPLEKAMQKGLVTYLTPTVTNDYVKLCLNCVEKPQNPSLKVVYTPLNGTGLVPLTTAFEVLGYNNVFIPKTQAQPDENFTTAPNPNPELLEVYQESLKLAKEKKADLLVATDPDCDRLGAMVYHKGKYWQLNGDQVGSILLFSILEQRWLSGTLTKHSFMVTSVVSSVLSEMVATHFGVQTIKTLTGFKNIGNKVEEQLTKLKEKNLEQDAFTFAYEESIGYMANEFIRDKDGILPTLLLLNLANRLKQDKKTLMDYLNIIYKTVGFVENKNYNFEFVGLEGIAKIQNSVNNLRNNPPTTIGKWKVTKVIDYENSKLTKLEKQNFLEFVLEGGHKVIVRPSGTEPKLKVYITTIAKNKALAQKRATALQKAINKLLF